MTTQALTPNTILGNISLSDPSEIDTTQPFPETVAPTSTVMTSRATSSS